MIKKIVTQQSIDIQIEYHSQQKGVYKEPVAISQERKEIRNQQWGDGWGMKKGCSFADNESIFTWMKWCHWSALSRALQKQLGGKEEVGRLTRGWRSSRCGESMRNLFTSLRKRPSESKEGSKESAGKEWILDKLWGSMRFIDSLSTVQEAKSRTEHYFNPRAFMTRRTESPLV